MGAGKCGGGGGERPAASTFLFLVLPPPLRGCLLLSMKSDGLMLDIQERSCWYDKLSLLVNAFHDAVLFRVIN